MFKFLNVLIKHLVLQIKLIKFFRAKISLSSKSISMSFILALGKLYILNCKQSSFFLKYNFVGCRHATNKYYKFNKGY